MPSSRAACATGGAESLRPRPRGRSGRVRTRTGRCSEAASRSSTGTANEDVPIYTVLTAAAGRPAGPRLGGGLRLAQYPHGLLALVARRAIEDQQTVEMID